MNKKYNTIINKIIEVTQTLPDAMESSVDSIVCKIKNRMSAVHSFLLTRKKNVQSFHANPKPLLAEKATIAIARRQKVRTAIDKISFAVLLWICRYKACKGKTSHTYKCGWLKRKFLSVSGVENLCAEKKLTTKKDGKKITVSWLE